MIVMLTTHRQPQWHPLCAYLGRNQAQSGKRHIQPLA